MRILVACASSAFSTSSLTTDAGRSTTSPAAIWSISASGSSLTFAWPLTVSPQGSFFELETDVI